MGLLTYLRLVTQTADFTIINLEEKTVRLDLLDGSSDLLTLDKVGKS